MPDIDEDILRDLMARATDDLVAPRAATARAIQRHRRHRTRIQVTAVAGTAAAAGLAAGVLVPAMGASSSENGTRPSASSASSATPVQLTATQRALFGLSAAAAATPRPEGRYVVLTEQTTTTSPNGTAAPTKEAGGKMTVIDTVTGGSTLYQDITVTNADGMPAPPAVATGAPGGLPTRAQLDAMPTGTTALYNFLLAQAKQQIAQEQQLVQKLRKAGKAYPVPKSHEVENNDDLVYEQAADLLWEPDLSPSLRSALYKVLAATPGMTVRTGATDSSGHPATEISRLDPVGGDTVEVFVNPANGATLESAWVGPGTSFAEDLYQSVRYTSTIPADPYQG
jgi:hypothetical protein